MKFKLIKIDDIIEFPKNTSKYLSKYLQYLFTMICLFSKRKKKCCMYWIAFSLLPLKLYAWPCKCILEIHSWLQRKMVYVICELTWFFQKQKSTNIGTLLCKLVVYVFVRCHPKHLKIAKQLADWLYIPINLELCQVIYFVFEKTMLINVYCTSHACILFCLNQQ